MKNRPSPRSPGWIIALLLVMSVLAQAASPNPDLTAAGAIATLKTDTNSSPVYGETYNLGATGLRGWIYLSSGWGNTHGADGTMTGESRQILVTVAVAPGNAVLAVDDVILGAMAANSGTVSAFASDARKAFGTAIGDAEKSGAGTLRVKRWRAGTTTDVNIPITILGDYTATAPYSCPKSTAILANARNKLVSQLLADANFLTADWAGGISGLALLAGVAPGDPNYATVQTRLQTYARALAAIRRQRSCDYALSAGKSHGAFSGLPFPRSDMNFRSGCFWWNRADWSNQTLRTVCAPMPARRAAWAGSIPTPGSASAGSANAFLRVGTMPPPCSARASGGAGTETRRSPRFTMARRPRRG